MRSWRTAGVVPALMLVVGVTASALAAARTDSFNREPLSPAWTFFAPGGGSYEVRDGWLHITSPGFRWMMIDREEEMGAALLIRPPSDGVFTFETRLRFTEAPAIGAAGVIAVRDDLHSAMTFGLRPGARRVAAAWRGGIGFESAGSLWVGVTDEMWLRVEFPPEVPEGETRFFYKARDDEEWVLATTEGIARVPRPFDMPELVQPKFPRGVAYGIGLFVEGAWGDPAEDNKVEVAFDYFHSPQLQPLAVELGGKAATSWAAMKGW